MLIVLFLLGQTIITDFQVNSEDYPGHSPQLYPSITCYDSGGAIIWYDLRTPTNGMRVFGTLINAFGDTINTNFCLNDDTTAGCMSQPSIDGDTSGNFVIVYIQRQNVLSRRFNKNGIPNGLSFVVNSVSGCSYPAIAVSKSGRSVIVWLKNYENRIYGQIFDANGNPVGTNFLVSDSAVAYSYQIPGVGIKDNGNFIVSWSFNNEIWAQIFDSVGNRIGENFKLINDTASTSESYPKLKFDEQGNLFVSWMASVGGQGDINCQIFDSTLTPITGIIKIDEVGIDTARYQAIAVKDSIFFVAFQNGISAVYLQRIKCNGELIGNNIRISEPVGTRNMNPKIDLTSQYFIITWARCLSGNIYDYDIVCQKVSFDGNLIGNNYVITDDKGGEAQILPGIVADNNGNFFIVWTDWRRYPDYFNLPNCYSRRYNAYANPYGDDFRINTYANADYSTIGINSNIYLVVWARTLPDSNHQIYAQRFDYDGNPIGENYQISISSGIDQLSFPRITTLSNGRFVVIWHENIATIDKIYGMILDTMGIPYGNQFNPYVDSSGYNLGWSAVDEGNGKFVVPISCNTGDSVIIAIQEFDYNGIPVSSSIILNDEPASYYPICGARGIDRYLFVWLNANQTKMIGQFLDSTLQKIGNNFIISDDTIAYKNFYSVVSNSDGKFFVLWDDQPNGNADLFGQFFDSQGNKIGDNFRVDNDTTNAEQSYASCFSANNRIYIVWNDTRIPAHWFDVYCKIIEWPDGQEIMEVEKISHKIALIVSPNPFKNHCLIKFQIQNKSAIRNPKSEISLKIYDVSGRVVKSFNPESCILNHTSGIIWSGNDDLGRRLPAGVYFVRLEAGDYKQGEKAILLR
ncbi:MAG: T9SS type A sorting domain-containing protein [candidate division WOR-3 bacterium]